MKPTGLPEPPDQFIREASAALQAHAQPGFGDFGAAFDDIFDDAADLQRLEALSLRDAFGQRSITTVLDCACGTGLHALGLAHLGYQVSASDISSRLVRIVRRRARAQGLHLEARQADFRNLEPWRGREFDAVVAAGTSLPLLPSFDEVIEALRSMRALTAAGGAVVVGNRDYDVPRVSQQVMVPRRLIFRKGAPEWIVDLRLFGPDRANVTTTFLRLSRGRWRIRRHVKSYLYVGAEKMAQLMQQAGLRAVTVLDVTGYRPYDGGEWYLVAGTK